MALLPAQPLAKFSFSTELIAMTLIEGHTIKQTLVEKGLPKGIRIIEVKTHHDINFNITVIDVIYTHPSLELVEPGEEIPTTRITFQDKGV